MDQKERATLGKQVTVDKRLGNMGWGEALRQLAAEEQTKFQSLLLAPCEEFEKRNELSLIPKVPLLPSRRAFDSFKINNYFLLLKLPSDTTEKLGGLQG